MGCSSSAFSATTPDITAGQSFHEKYRLGSKIGRGSFAQVRDATNVATGQELAVKIIDLRARKPQNDNSGRPLGFKEHPTCPRKIRASTNEAKVQQMIGNHKNIVNLLDDPFEEGVIFYLAMEKCSLSLWDAMERSEVTENLLAGIFREMLLGIAYIHSLSVVHRDIKPDNFLYGSCKENIQPDLKLCDFGLSEVLPHPDAILPGIFGTAPFMSPEMLSSKGANEKTDIWSLSVMAYVLMLGQFPYIPRNQTPQDMKTVIMEGRSPPTFEVQSRLNHLEGPSSGAIDFLKALHDRERSTRLSAQAALQLPFLSAKSKPETEKSLRPMIMSARKCGAFEQRNLNKETELDGQLNLLQMEFQGSRIESKKDDDELKRVRRDPNRSSKSIGNTGRSGASWDTTTSTELNTVSTEAESVTSEPSIVWENRTGSTTSLQSGYQPSSTIRDV